MNFIINVFKFHLKNVYLCSEKAFATKFLFLVKHFRPAWKNENDVRKGHYTNFFNFQFEIYLPFLLLNSYSTQRITSTSFQWDFHIKAQHDYRSCPQEWMTRKLILFQESWLFPLINDFSDCSPWVSFCLKISALIELKSARTTSWFKVRMFELMEISIIFNLFKIIMDHNYLSFSLNLHFEGNNFLVLIVSFSSYYDFSLLINTIFICQMSFVFLYLLIIKKLSPMEAVFQFAVLKDI